MTSPFHEVLEQTVTHALAYFEQLELAPVGATTLYAGLGLQLANERAGRVTRHRGGRTGPEAGRKISVSLPNMRVMLDAQTFHWPDAHLRACDVRSGYHPKCGASFQTKGGHMSDSDPVEIVQAWVVAANAQDIEGLLALSDPDIEVAGPRGAGRGQQLLRDWLARAGLSLQTLRVFAAADAVVLDQRGTWRSRESGEVTGDMAVASAFRVRDGHVTWFARFDHVDAALTAAGLHPSDERRASGGR